MRFATGGSSLLRHRTCAVRAFSRRCAARVPCPFGFRRSLGERSRSPICGLRAFPSPRSHVAMPVRGGAFRAPPSTFEAVPFRRGPEGAARWSAPPRAAEKRLCSPPTDWRGELSADRNERRLSAARERCAYRSKSHREPGGRGPRYRTRNMPGRQGPSPASKRGFHGNLELRHGRRLVPMETSNCGAEGALFPWKPQTAPLNPGRG